jgi:phage-related protein (TIGR01555 family)
MNNENGSPSEAINRLDGWINAVTRLGTVVDPKTATKFRPGQRFPEPLLDALYESDGFVKKIVNAFPEHAVRRWCDFEGDEEGKIADIMDDLSVREIFGDAGEKGLLYGAAVAVVYVNGESLNLEKPIDLTSLRSIDALEVFDRYSISISKRYESGINSGKAEVYQLTRVDGSTALVHESRTLYFDGVNATPRRRRENEGFGVSIVEHTFEAVRALGVAFGSMETILQFFEVGVIKVKDLAQAIATGQEDRLKMRAEIMNLTKSLLNAIYIDSDGEDYDRKSSSVAGLPDILDRFVLQVSGVSKIPAKIFMGQQTAGMGAKDDADLKIFYDDVASFQRTKFNPPLRRILQIIIACSEYGIDSECKIRPKWRSLYEPTEKESAEARKLQAEADQIYLTNSVLTAEEVRQSRFENGYSFETDVDSLDPVPTPVPPPVSGAKPPAAGATE